VFFSLSIITIRDLARSQNPNCVIAKIDNAEGDSRRPMQMSDKQSMHLEDRFHRTVKITQLSDSRVLTGACDVQRQYMNDVPTYIQRWLQDSFAQWDLNAVPEGFEIPQGEVPHEPAKHHCPEFQLLLRCRPAPE